MLRVALTDGGTNKDVAQDRSGPVKHNDRETLPSASPRSEERWFSIEQSLPNTPSAKAASPLAQCVTSGQQGPGEDQNSAPQAEAPRTPVERARVRGFNESNQGLTREIHSPQLPEGPNHGTRGGIPSYRLTERRARCLSTHRVTCRDSHFFSASVILAMT